MSGCSFFAPWFASSSARSFPSVPAWPLVHLNFDGAARRLRWYAAIWNHILLLTLVHPLSSQLLRCFVRPSIAYLESDVIVSGVIGSLICRAIAIAAISPVWLDWSSPGTLIAQFQGWFSPNQMPLPLTAFNLPLLMQDPSVNIVSGAICCPCSNLGLCKRYAGSCVSFALFVRTLKHSSSVSLVVIVGSKVISSPVSIFAL